MTPDPIVENAILKVQINALPITVVSQVESVPDRDVVVLLLLCGEPHAFRTWSIVMPTTISRRLAAFSIFASAFTFSARSSRGDLTGACSRELPVVTLTVISRLNDGRV